ncbi:MAG TPA: flagellar biosynthesis anti-sigma factor FlgM [Armatimonadota bacterium]|nr:flagellar biosynthesis anti-sigma factor FlgM [Armatimonadota bacterium]
MKISERAPLSNAAAVTPAPSVSGAERSSIASAAGDSVSLSPRGREVAKLKEVIRNLPEVDAGRVAELRAKIAAGEYQVPATAVADRLFASLRDLS